MREKFRFEKLEIWQIAITLSDQLLDISDQLEERRLYRFADQLRGMGLSVPTILPKVQDYFPKKTLLTS